MTLFKLSPEEAQHEAAVIEIARLEVEVARLRADLATTERHLAYSETRRCKCAEPRGPTALEAQVSGLLSQVKAQDEDRRVLRAELATTRALAFREAAEMMWGPSHEAVSQAFLDAAPLSPLLVAVKPCHICGSIDAVITDRASICSRGHQ